MSQQMPFKSPLHSFCCFLPFCGSKGKDEEESDGSMDQKMDARSAIADTMLLAMSTAMQAMPRRTSSRRLSDFSDIAHLTVSFNGIKLTSAQHLLIKNAYEHWRRRSENTAGKIIENKAIQPHAYIASRVPRLRDLFLAQPAIASRHAEVITSILDMAVESVESLDDSLGPLIVSYSSEDGILEEREGFDRFYWSKVSEGLCQLARQFPIKTNKCEMIAAWRIIILFILSKLEYGFQLSRKASYDVNQTSFDNPCYK